MLRGRASPWFSVLKNWPKAWWQSNFYAMALAPSAPKHSKLLPLGPTAYNPRFDALTLSTYTSWLKLSTLKNKNN
jgi:hypothetical protein